MKKIFLLMIAGLLLTSCDIQKEAAKHKEETAISQDWEQKQYKPSEPILFNPNLFKSVRDTTIVVVNSEGSKMRMQFDDKGQLREAECLPAMQEIVTRMSLLYEQQLKDKEKSKTEKFSDTWVLYIVAGIVMIIMFGMYLMQRSLNKKFDAFMAILAENVNK